MTEFLANLTAILVAIGTAADTLDKILTVYEKHFK